MTIQLSKSELLHTIKFGVGKKLLETKKVSIFDRKFELLLENVEPSSRTELINEFFGRKVDYSDPDKMISDWQSSKAGQKFIQIFNQISPDSDFNSTNLFNDKTAWNALRLANDVSDGKYDLQDAKDFQEIFLKRQGEPNADAKPGETKTDRNGRRMRARDLPNEPEAPAPLKALPPAIADFLRQIQFRHYFEQLTEEMLNKYTKTLGADKKIEFQEIIEEHFDGIFGNFLKLNEEFTVEEIRDVIREALNDARTGKIPLKGTPNQIYRPMTIGQRPVDPSGHTRSGAHELGGKYDNISVDNEKAINQQKTPDWMRGEDLPDAEEYTDDSLPDAEEVGRDTEEVELTGTEDLPTAEEVPGDNIPTDFADAVDNFLIVPIVEIISEADTKPGVAKTNPKNMVLQAVLPGAVIVGSKFAPQLVVNHQSVVSRILKDKLLFLARTGELYRALPQDVSKGVNAGQDTKTIRLERLPLGEKDENQLGLYFRELTSRGKPEQRQLLRDFTKKYQTTIQRNHEIQGTKADAITPAQTVIGGNDTKIDHTVNGISPTADTGEAAPYVAGPQTQPDSQQNTGKAGWSDVPNNSIAGEPPTAPNLNPQDDEASQIGKTQVLTPAEQKLPIQIIGEMTKTIFEFIKKNLEHIESPKRKAAVVAWLQDAFERAVQEIPKTKQAVVAANAPSAQAKPNAPAASPVAANPTTSASPVAAPTASPITPTTPVNPATNAPVAASAPTPSAAIPQPSQAAPVVATASPMAAAAKSASKRKAKVPNAAAPVATTPPVSNAAPIAAPVEQPVEPKNVKTGDGYTKEHGQSIADIIKYALGPNPETVESIFKQVIQNLQEGVSDPFVPTVEELVKGRFAARQVLDSVLKSRAGGGDGEKITVFGDEAKLTRVGGQPILESASGKILPDAKTRRVAKLLLHLAIERLKKLEARLGEQYHGYFDSIKTLFNSNLDNHLFIYEYPENSHRAQGLAKNAENALGLNQPETQAVPPVTEQPPEATPAPIAAAQPVAPKVRTPKAAKVASAPVAQGYPKGWSPSEVSNKLPAGSDPLPIAPVPSEPTVAPQENPTAPEQDSGIIRNVDALLSGADEFMKTWSANKTARKAGAAKPVVAGPVAKTPTPAVAPKAQATQPVVQPPKQGAIGGEIKERLDRIMRSASSGGIPVEKQIAAFNDQEHGALAGTGMVATGTDAIKSAPKNREDDVLRLKNENGLILIRQPNSNEYLIVPTRGMSYETSAGLGLVQSNATIRDVAAATIRGFIRDQELGKMTIVNGDVDWDTVIPTKVTINN